MSEYDTAWLGMPLFASAGASPVEPNFCESCAMGLSTCDCVTPRPVFVNQLPSAQPSQADAQDAARYRWLREYLPSDDLQYDDDLVLAKTGAEIDAAIDAAINAKEAK